MTLFYTIKIKIVNEFKNDILFYYKLPSTKWCTDDLLYYVSVSLPLKEIGFVDLLRTPPALTFCDFVCSLRRSVTSQFFGIPWTVVRQAPLSMGFSRQGYWSGLPFPPPGDLPNPGIEPESLVSPALAGRFFITALRSLPALTVYDLDTWVVCKQKACTQVWHFVADKAPSHPCHLILTEMFWGNRTGVLFPVCQVQNHFFLIFIFLTPRTFCIGV